VQLVQNVRIRKAFALAGSVASLVGMVILLHRYARVCKDIGVWSYPLTMGVYMTMSGIALLAVAPPKHRKSMVFSWMRPIIEQFIGQVEIKLSAGVWKRVSTKGAFVFIAMVTIATNPFIAGVVARSLKLPEEKLWHFVFLSNAISAIIWSTVFIGAGNLIPAIQNLFATL